MGCLQVHHCFMLRYFMEVLLFNIMMQLYLLFEYCFPVMFLQPNHVINIANILAHVSADKSTNALLKEKTKQKKLQYLSVFVETRYF